MFYRNIIKVVVHSLSFHDNRMQQIFEILPCGSHEENLSVTAAWPPFHISLVRPAWATQPLTLLSASAERIPRRISLPNFGKKSCTNTVGCTITSPSRENDNVNENQLPPKLQT